MSILFPRGKSVASSVLGVMWKALHDLGSQVLGLPMPFVWHGLATTNPFNRALAGHLPGISLASIVSLSTQSQLTAAWSLCNSIVYTIVSLDCHFSALVDLPADMQGWVIISKFRGWDI
jgi:hypothetical protein